MTNSKVLGGKYTLSKKNFKVRLSTLNKNPSRSNYREGERHKRRLCSNIKPDIQNLLFSSIYIRSNEI